MPVLGTRDVRIGRRSMVLALGGIDRCLYPLSVGLIAAFTGPSGLARDNVLSMSRCGLDGIAGPFAKSIGMHSVAEPASLNVLAACMHCAASAWMACRRRAKTFSARLIRIQKMQAR